jgi:FMN phosphatase YigB (HAD superfamily)
VVRTIARPADVFRAAAERAVPGPPDRPGRAALVNEAARRRRIAELQAVDELGVDAVGLDEVYARLGDLSALGLDPEELRAGELALERDEARPVRAGIERVEAARAAGRRILFVSDMYLPASAIREPLERFGIARPDEPLYVSGELGVSKRTGRMFDHVLAQEGLRPDELVHTGDDAHNDIASPAARGIAVEPLTIARLNRFEREVLAHSPAPGLAATRIAGASRVARLARGGETGDRVHAAGIGGNVAGPLFAAYVAWVLRTAREEGIERLYFVSRDAQVFLRIAREIARDGDPECRYLLGSRQAWFLPGIDAIDPESLHWVLKPGWALRTPSALLPKLGVEAAEVEDELRARGLSADVPLEQHETGRFWELVDAIAPLIRERVLEARETAIAYFGQEGMLDAGRWALVDLGWRLTAQSALRKVLRAAGREEEVTGFYLAINSRRSRLADSGELRAFFVEDDDPRGEPMLDSWLYSHQDVIEQVFAMADHGSCTGYRREGDAVVPVLREERRDPRRDAFARHLQDATVECARELARAGLLDRHHAAVRAAALAAGRLAVTSPTREEAAALAWLPVGDDQNESRLRPLAGPLTPADIPGRLGPPASDEGDSLEADTFWPEGSLALTAAPTRAALLALRAVRARLPLGGHNGAP